MGKRIDGLPYKKPCGGLVGLPEGKKGKRYREMRWKRARVLGGVFGRATLVTRDKSDGGQCNGPITDCCLQREYRSMYFLL